MCCKSSDRVILAAWFQIMLFVDFWVLGSKNFSMFSLVSYQAFEWNQYRDISRKKLHNLTTLELQNNLTDNTFTKLNRRNRRFRDQKRAKTFNRVIICSKRQKWVHSTSCGGDFFFLMKHHIQALVSNHNTCSIPNMTIL